MAPLGPFEPNPHVAVAVSGGADSLALAVLTTNWARARGGRVRGLVVDHGLRAASAAEAGLTMARLRAIGVEPELLTLTGLAPGAAMAERARTARHAALETACAQAGILHLLFGHHAADQAETVAMRALRGPAQAGLAGMAALVETARVRRLRPLLTVPGGRLRATLTAASMDWVEDPSNTDPRSERVRVRMLRGDRDGDGPATQAGVQAALHWAARRASMEAADAAWLAASAHIHPEGFAVLANTAMRPGAVAALLRAIAGRIYPVPADQVAAWVRAPRPATLAGVRIIPAGRLAPGDFLLVREAAAIGPDIAWRPGATWDGRFRVVAGQVPAGVMIGALGTDAAGLRKLSPLRACVLEALPALRQAGRLFAVPHLGYGETLNVCGAKLVFDPPVPAGASPFFVG